jgi:uncharacterized protein (DUF1778 family)
MPNEPKTAWLDLCAEVVADRTECVLDDRAWNEFATALDRPAEVNPAVVELMRRQPPE